MKTQTTFRPYSPLVTSWHGRWLPEDHLVYFIRHLRKTPLSPPAHRRNNGDWVYNPIENPIFEPDSSLIFMINLEKGLALESIFLNR
jgi:hypothetical protein